MSIFLRHKLNSMLLPSLASVIRSAGFFSLDPDFYKGQPRTSTDLESAPDIDSNRRLEPRVAASFVVPQASRGAARMTTTPFVRMS
jgi:hypothetical protein